MASVDLSVEEIVDMLRKEGSDIADVEAKRAGFGYPNDLPPTLSAFGNMPGGGVILLEVDERSGFTVTGVYDSSDAKRRLGAQLRDSVSPPLQGDISEAIFDGKKLIIARVNELAAAHKPCLVRANGRAYLRSYDGDYPLSEQERAAFIAERTAPRYDRDPVEGADNSDLDTELVKAFIANCRQRSPRLGAMEDESILRHTRIIASTGELTLGGLYALGNYPQQFIPSLSISARVSPLPGDPPGTRSKDIAHFDGPLPELLDQAMNWVRRNTTTRVWFGDDGHGRDEPQYPNEAVRELVANALVHRDLGPHALGDRVHLVLDPDRLIITNPGGLYGLTVEQLGTRQGGSARNQSLYDITKDVRTIDGRRIIEGVGTGILAAKSALARAGLTPPTFLDSGIRFTAIIPHSEKTKPREKLVIESVNSLLPKADKETEPLITRNGGLILEQLANGPLTAAMISAVTNLSDRQVNFALKKLENAGKVVVHGGKGQRGTTYSLHDARQKIIR